MNEEKFILKHHQKWQRLEEYNAILAKKNLSSFSKEDIRSYTELFRMAGHHLAYARTHFQSSKTTSYLNQLVGVSHNVFFLREKSGWWDIKNYFTTVFPRKIVDEKNYVLTALLVFLVGMFFTFAVVLINPDSFYFFFPQEQADQINFNSSAKSWDYPVMSSYIMVNNIKVSLMALALGITAGVGTLYVMLANGMIIGALTAYILANGGSMLSYWSLILPHGFLELTAIFISGGAGLLIGRGLLIPGDLDRKGSLIKVAREAGMLVPGIIALLVIAGVIEGFFTPLDIHPYFKILFAFTTLATLCVYLFWGLRKKTS